MATALPLAVLIFGGGIAHAVPGDQAGVTDNPSADQSGVTTPSVPDEQAGVSTPPRTPAPPPRPQEQSPLGAVIPDPAPRAPSDYRALPRPDNRSGNSGGDGSGLWQGPGRPSTPAPSLGEELGGLHAPQPVEPPKLLTPPPPNLLGVGDATIVSPLPADATWEINEHLAEAQAVTDGWFQSIGFSENRSTRMAVGGVAGGALGAAIGFTTACVPVAIVTGAGGALIGAGVGAALGATVPIPVPGVDSLPGAVVGAGIGAAAGAAAGCAAAGAVGAALGGAAGAVLGVAVTAGDGSALPPRPETPPPAEAAPPPSIHDQVQAVVDNTIFAGEQAVDWAEAQPRGQAALADAAAFAEDGIEWVQQQTWAAPAAVAVTRAAQDAVEWAQSQPQLAEVIDAAVDVIDHTPPLAPGQLGPFTDQANAALAAVQAAVG
ncbi:hypothetical protein [Nocardia sp. CY41]|uniref:hypothetical protein n=1 Tax=Nocardia sp. CY41 TaxID=2608686 RepID=UPI00135CC75D|nr:hypothetical protein [Nocardia sp. CY41]